MYFEQREIREYERLLASELGALDGYHAQDRETGSSNVDQGAFASYSNRLFGSPFQLLDSVDARFEGINKHVGSEYLRHFLLHSPILHIRPGMPDYTGADDPTSLRNVMKDMYITSRSDNGRTRVSSLLQSLATNVIFGGGKRLQRRMFCFRESYLDYAMYANFLCRSMAILLSLTENESGNPFPTGTFAGVGGGYEFQEFLDFRWENYRMTGRYVNSALEQLQAIFGAATSRLTSFANGALSRFHNIVPESSDGRSTSQSSIVRQAMRYAEDNEVSTVFDVMADKITSVMFAVDPVSFTENLRNETGPSLIENMVTGATGTIGSEIAFITNSNVDVGVIGDVAGFLGSTVTQASMSLADLTQSVTGGFASNLFSGAMKSIKGQKMIYPDIYKSSSSELDHDFSITLTSPYGDVYNYFMNIVVPLMHLIALVAPRMVTANTVTSPFIVQAFIPGMVTCQLGIISNMTITKNPTAKHVSANGFPLTVKVTFTIKELYNSLAISPAHDPASFLFNETLNDYMANMAGLIPSMDTFSRKRDALFGNLGNYFRDEWLEDIANGALGIFNPFSRATR